MAQETFGILGTYHSTYMKEINIKLNSNQYKALLKLIYLGEWVLNSNLDRSGEKLTIEEEVEQIVYASNPEPGLFEYDNEFGLYFPTRDFEDKMQKFIDDYNNYNFWEELAYQLADRDTKIELGDKLDKIGTREYIEIHQKHLEFYAEEFNNNNLNNVKIT
jgi:hypothetical protein